MTQDDDLPEIEALPEDLAALWTEHFSRILPVMRERGRVYLDVISVAHFHPDLLADCDWVEEAIEFENDAYEDVEDAPADKPATPTDQVYGALQAAYEHFNTALFDGSLPRCLITVQRKARTKGYYSPNKFASMDGTEQTDEIALHPGYFRVCTPRDTASTLAHEMVHHWQQHFGTPHRRGYHDREWAAKMVEIGLQPSSTEAPGGKITGYRVSHYILDGEAFDRAYAAFEATGQTVGWGDAATGGTEAKAKPKRTKFVCPICGFNVLAKASGHPECRDCNHEPMLAAPTSSNEVGQHDARDLRKLAKDLGYSVELTQRDHLKCKHPNGSLVHVGSGVTVRAQRNAQAHLQRGVRTPATLHTETSA